MRLNLPGALFVTGLLSAATFPSDLPLINAAQEGDVGAVESLLKQGADPNAATGDGMTALHWAAERGHQKVIELLISSGAAVDTRTRIGKYTPLHLASRGGHGGIARVLLEAGSNPNATTTTSGVTPLHLAAASIGGADAVAALLEHGAEANATEASSGQTPLIFAAAYNRAAAVTTLLEHDANPSVMTEVVDVIQSLLLDREANRHFRDAVSSFRESRESRGNWEPSSNQVQEAVSAQRQFLSSGQNVEDRDPDDLISLRSDYPGGPDVKRPPYRETLVGMTGGMTALLHAAREGHSEAALALLEGSADVNQVSGGDRTSPLLMAVLNGQFDLALLLLEWGADPNLKASTDGVAPLFAVLQTQWAPKSNYPQPRAQDIQQAEYLDVLKALLEAGANPNVQLNTHLWYWEYGLTKMGIDLTGATPFWRAAFAQDLGALRLLADHGADPNIPTWWPEVGMRERRQEDGRQQEDSGITSIPYGTDNAHPIHAAAGGGYLGLGAFSVRNVPDQFIPTVKYLVEEHGADVNLADSWGYTPLHYAASRGDNEMILYLMSEGADISAITRLGQSTADMARGGRAGFFTRVAFPETEALLISLGSTLECLHTHFLDTGDYCPGSGVNRDEWGNTTNQRKPLIGGTPRD